MHRWRRWDQEEKHCNLYLYIVAVSNHFQQISFKTPEVDHSVTVKSFSSRLLSHFEVENARVQLRNMYTLLMFK